MNKLMHKYGGKTSDEIAKMKKEENQQVSEQHREKGRFKPIKPHNVPETPGAMMKKEETQLDEISHETKASYTLKAKQQVKELEPHAEKGEYKDLAKNLIAKRKKGIAMAKEAVDVPFAGSKPAKGTVTDKSGAKHTPMSRVRDLARKALERQKQAMKPVKESESESRKKQIVKDAAKNGSKKTKDVFDPEPEMSSEITKQ